VINLSVCTRIYAYVICNKSNLVLRKEKGERKWKKCKREKERARRGKEIKRKEMMKRRNQQKEEHFKNTLINNLRTGIPAAIL
jgi:hypothetical protein